MFQAETECSACVSGRRKMALASLVGLPAISATVSMSWGQPMLLSRRLTREP